MKNPRGQGAGIPERKHMGGLKGIASTRFPQRNALAFPSANVPSTRRKSPPKRIARNCIRLWARNRMTRHNITMPLFNLGAKSASSAQLRPLDATDSRANRKTTFDCIKFSLQAE